MTIVIGTFLLHTTRELDISLSQFSHLAHAPSTASSITGTHANVRYGELPLSSRVSANGLLSPASSNLTALTGVNATAGAAARVRQADMS